MAFGTLRFLRRLIVTVLVVGLIILLWPLFEKIFGKYTWFQKITEVGKQVFDFVFHGGLIARIRSLFRSIQSLF